MMDFESFCVSDRESFDSGVPSLLSEHAVSVSAEMRMREENTLRINHFLPSGGMKRAKVPRLVGANWSLASHWLLF